ncbi:MAG: helix-turn-helix transcriptional regulator [Clostridia bacterium]|nr:helix-turn-helix transcriptional regulator [Clostridia bacterium]
MESKELKQIVAQNIYYLRTENHLTQYELGQKLNYSDKAISKWERADGLPDALVLLEMSKLFNVTVDYILTEHKEQDKRVETAPQSRVKKIISLIAIVGVYSIALLAYVMLAVAEINHWQIFIYALPVCAIVAIIFSSVWHKGRGVFAYGSVLVWSILATVYFAITSAIGYNNMLWMIFLIGIPLQIIVFLAFGIKITITFNKNKLPKLRKNSKGEIDEKVNENSSQAQ